MRQSMRPFATIFVVLLLALATEMGEARICETPSHKFKGLCLSDRNCASVCESERFSGGTCRGARRRCFCTKPCLSP